MTYRARTQFLFKLLNNKTIKNSATQDDQAALLKQRLLMQLTALVPSYVPGKYESGDITVSVDLVGKKIFGNVKLAKTVLADVQKKIEDAFRTNAVRLLGGDATGWIIGCGFSMFPAPKKV